MTRLFFALDCGATRLVPIQEIVASIRILNTFAAVCVIALTFAEMGSRHRWDGASDVCLTLADTEPVVTPKPLTMLERCHAERPADADIAADLGAAYEAAGAVDRAEAAYADAVHSDPDYADVQIRLARLLLNRRAVDEARAHVEAALRVQPNRQPLLDLLRQTEHVE